MSAITEEDIESFLTALRAGDADKKINLLQLWGIKLDSVTELPERGIDAITLLVAPFLRSTAHLLVTSTLSGFLPVFLPLVPATNSTPPHLRLAVTQLLPGLVEKLNDPKDKLSEPAKDLIALLGRKCYDADRAERADLSASASTSKGKDKEGLATIWENALKEVLAGRGVRAKIGTLKMLLAMRDDKAAKLLLKPWLPSLVNLLEDSDGGVRDQARETVVALLSPPAPSAARSELKKLMMQRNVRKSISDGILTRILAPVTATSGASTPAPDAEPKESGSGFRSGATTPAEDIPVVYVASARDLDSEFKAMLPHFAGKETEHNWGPRERDMLRIRGMLRGKVFSQQPDTFVAGLKDGVLDGIIKTLLSLRTTVAQHACGLVQELAEHLESSFDQFVEPLLPTLGKMAGFTKRIIAERSQRGVTAMIKHGTAHRVLLGHILSWVGDKSVQTRQYCAGHLKVLLDTVAKNPASIEFPGAVDQIEQALKKALTDVNPQAREQARAAFWSFDRVWPRRGATFIDSLDPTARKQLERANGGIAASAPSTPAKPSVSRPRASAAILAAKRARAAELAAERAAAERGDGNTGAGNNGALLEHAAEVATPEPFTPGPLRRFREMPLEPASPSPAFPRALQQKAAEVQHLMATSPPVVQRPLTEAPSPVEVDKPLPVAPAPFERNGDADAVVEVSPKTIPSRSLISVDEEAPRRLSGLSAPSPATVATPIPSPAIKSPTPSSTSSGRSHSPGLVRSMSRSPPSLMESMHQPFRSPSGVRPDTASSEASGAVNLRTPVQQRFGSSRPSRAGDSLISTSPYSNTSSIPSPLAPAAAPLSRGEYYNRSPIDPADEARRAQVAQGLSAAQQLLDFDDDQMDMDFQQPITPARPQVRPSPRQYTPSTPSQQGSSAYRTPRNPSGSGRTHQVWEDSPQAMTPKVLKRLEGRNTERNWWAQRRERLEQVRPYCKEPMHGASAIEDDIANLAAGRPDIVNLQRLTAFSEQNVIALPGQPDEGNISSQRLIWVDDRLFDRLLHSVLAFLEPSQPHDYLEWALVLLWEMAKNQWVMFDTQEDAVLDALFRLRTLNNSVVLGSTNALMSLLADVCDPPFLLSLLHNALERYLDANPSASGRSDNGGHDVGNTGGVVRAAGYTFALNAVGMCILHLPKEAVEVEAKRLSKEVCTAIADKHVHARQAGYAVMLAVQCILSDDVRTLALFPKLDSGQRSFATYLMENHRLLGRATSETEALARRESVHGELVGGLNKRQMK